MRLEESMMECPLTRFRQYWLRAFVEVTRHQDHGELTNFVNRSGIMYTPNMGSREYLRKVRDVCSYFGIAKSRVLTHIPWSYVSIATKLSFACPSNRIENSMLNEFKSKAGWWFDWHLVGDEVAHIDGETHIEIWSIAIDVTRTPRAVVFRSSSIKLIGRRPGGVGPSGGWVVFMVRDSR